MTSKSKACGRELGAALRAHRERAGLGLNELARVLGWDPGVLSRLETGDRTISEVDMVHHLARCGVSYEGITELVPLVRAANFANGHWLAPHAPMLDEAVRSLVFHEASATASHSYEPQMIPGLLQTERYAHAMIGAEGGHTPEEVNFHVGARIQRQRALHRGDAQFVFFIHEHALHLMIGDAAVMHEQLLSLVFATASQRVVVRVIPASAGERSVFGGAFRVFSFAESRPLAYLDGYITGLFIEDLAQVQRYWKLFPRLDAVALDPGQSRDVLAKLASRYDHPGDRHGRHHLAQEQL
ncbi:helix-turn-helix domain-containing protein [Actinokineospora spheciospongiae]|uniref:helix-turn-helix domain-containing protein n=1 Tax=Actinokineospora spheciospongiae TaxID=909613 RepID=UPI00055674C8|nr:helix-turn-helix transcriptional regulator [Actinokineospora spheciospongiae]PWW61927.1 helix-turn-helix protein [Actinokineospora spheciospongiae]